MNIQNLQFKVHLSNGNVLVSDRASRESMREEHMRAHNQLISDADLDKKIKNLIDTCESIKTMTVFAMSINKEVIFVNPNHITHIEVLKNKDDTFTMIDGVPAAVARGIVSMGHSINAIKELRAATGMNLKDAKHWVDVHCPKD